jgi:hypothetical protein
MDSPQPSPSSRPTPSRPPVRHLPNGAAPTPADRPAQDPADRSCCTIVLIDVAMSARNGWQEQRRMRDDLYDLVHGAVEYGGWAVEALSHSDTGDGFRFVLPLDLIQPTQVVDLFVLGLTAGLREHRRRVNEMARIRLRVAFDLGLVQQHRENWTGEPLVRVARLADAEPAREALQSDRRLDLVAVVSDVLYDFAIRHGLGYLAPGCFQPVRVRVKEFDRNAWLYKPVHCGAAA